MGQYTSYYLYQKFEKRGTQDWIPVYPNVYSINGDGTQPTVVKNQNDEECGFIPFEPTYRWIDSGTTCVGYDKYNVQFEQVSIDGGVTWQATGNERLGTLIEADSADCGFSYENEYLTFVPIESATTFAFNSISGDSISYSLDKGSTWNTLASGVSTPSVAVGQKIMWKASGLTVADNTYYHGIGTFSATGNFNVEGNIMSLVSGDSFVSATTISNDWQFASLFYENNNIVSAENLILPATTLAKNCYNSMFNSSSLTTPPQLPATSLTEGCYVQMFAYCNSLTTAPSLPATTLAKHCYADMFWHCTSLTTPPVLSATTLAEECCLYMFGECTSLTSEPSLLAKTLAKGCYKNMFYGCTSLTEVGLGQAMTLVEDCYSGMFYGCSSVHVVICWATNISATNCTANWLYGVASSGTFFSSKRIQVSWPRGASGIPTNWTQIEP